MEGAGFFVPVNQAQLAEAQGPGFPFFLPKGLILKNLLIDYWRQLHAREGYQEISTPVIGVGHMRACAQFHIFPLAAEADFLIFRQLPQNLRLEGLAPLFHLLFRKGRDKMKIKMRDGSIQEAGFEEELGRDAFRHTTAHILAQAVKRLYPDTFFASSRRFRCSSSSSWLGKDVP